jgi:[acyl-carrier-protein] S-malonyltransferase
VISGAAPAVERALKACQEAGASKCVPLAVSGPFHSRFMKPAGEALAPRLAAARISPCRVPVVANVSAALVTDPAQVRANLEAQVSSPVRWSASVEKMKAEGIDTFLELGPGRVLSGLIKRGFREARLANVEDLKSLDKAKEILN